MAITLPKWKYNETILFIKPKRKVSAIFLHCSASDNSAHDDVSVMKTWHVEDNGWSDVGYHFFINKNGNIQEGRSIEKIPIAQKGYNTGSIAICCHGLKKDKFTQKQMDSVKTLCGSIVNAFTDKIRIRGHREVSNKSCPVFDYKKVLGLDEKGYFVETGSPVAANPPQKVELPGINIKEINKGLKLRVIKIFDKNTSVLALQSILCQLGIQCSRDGVFGQQTKDAVKKIQKRYSLKIDGIVGGKTVDKMFSTATPVLKINDTGTDVFVLQLLLAMHGKSLIHDGVFGRGTKLALESVQRLLKLKNDGVFGPKSRKAMT